MRCEIRGPYCEGEAVNLQTPRKCCDDCFAWVGYRLVKPVPSWRKWYRRIRLFLLIVWRVDMSGSRMSIRTALDVAEIIHG